MKILTILFLFIATVCNAQLNLNDALKIALQNNYSTYSYHEEFVGHPSYGAPIISTLDGGALFLAATDIEKKVDVVKLDSTGAVAWKHSITAEFDEFETQSVVQDSEGNYYAFLLAYNYDEYRGGCEIVYCFDATGKLRWSKYLGDFAVLNNPICSYIHLLPDGKLELRGSIATKTEENKDPEYHFWTGWLNAKSELKEEIGGIIDWSNSDWKKFYEIEE